MLCRGVTGDDDDFVFEAIDQGFRELDFGHVFGGNLLEMGKPISNSGPGVEKGRRLSGGPRWRRNGKHRRIQRIRRFDDGPIRRPLEREQ
jgi:hypothetical protein